MNDSIIADANPVPSKAEHAANVVARSARQTTVAELVVTSARFPVWVMAEIDAMAVHSGQSRNHILNLVVGAGLEAVTAHLDKALADDLDKIAADELEVQRAKGKNVSGSI